MSASPTFVDSNVLVYAYDAEAGAKREQARHRLAELWEGATGRLSAQVLQETYVNLTRKVPVPLSLPDARDVISTYATWPIHLPDAAAILDASRVAERHRISFWDALIVVSARATGARVLLSEDLQHGQVIDGVRIENPFL